MAVGAGDPRFRLLHPKLDLVIFHFFPQPAFDVFGCDGDCLIGVQRVRCAENEMVQFKLFLQVFVDNFLDGAASVYEYVPYFVIEAGAWNGRGNPLSQVC